MEECRMYHIMSLNMKPGRDTEFKNWYKKNKENLAKYVPKGWKFVGVYGATMGLGKHDMTQIYEFKEFADLDRMRKYSHPVADRLNAEFMDFVLPGSFETMVLREADDWATMEPRKPQK
jgi:hypothetical protein